MQTANKNSIHAILVFLFLCYQLLTGDLVALSEADERLSATLYRQIVAEASPSRNFLIAPQQIEQLVNYLQPSIFEDETSRSSGEQLPPDNIQSIEDGIGGLSKFQLKPREPIKVINKLIITANNGNAHDDDDDDDDSHDHDNIDSTHNNLESLKEKLPNSRIEYRINSAKQRSSTSSDTSLKLINSITLQARWAFNIQKRDTHKRLFYNTPHSHVYMDNMRKDDIFRFGRLMDLNATALQLPLQDPGLSLLIVLPFEFDGLGRLEAQLSDLSVIEKIVKQRLRPTLVRVFMPKFKFKHSIELGKLLDESQIELNHTNIQHESAIEVNEDGIGRIEQRTVLFWNAYSSVRTTPDIFDMNHPFFFAIRNSEGIQFVGHLARL